MERKLQKQKRDQRQTTTNNALIARDAPVPILVKVDAQLGPNSKLAFRCKVAVRDGTITVLVKALPEFLQALGRDRRERYREQNL
jgi:hypothetical protein